MIALTKPNEHQYWTSLIDYSMPFFGTNLTPESLWLTHDSYNSSHSDNGTNAHGSETICYNRYAFLGVSPVDYYDEVMTRGGFNVASRGNESYSQVNRVMGWRPVLEYVSPCLLYTSDAADE